MTEPQKEEKPPLMKFVGYHGTCVSAAEDIMKNGFADKNQRKRCGPGGYLWAGDGILKERAIALSTAWWQQRANAGDYRYLKNQDIAIIKAEFSIEQKEFLDLDARVHHRLLVRLYHQSVNEKKPFPDDAALYTEYLKIQSDEYAAKNIGLKVVKALMPAPSGFHWPMTPYLTRNVQAYIVQPSALALLEPKSLERVFIPRLTRIR